VSGQRRGDRTYLALDLPEHAVLDLLVRERVGEELVACNDTHTGKHTHRLANTRGQKITARFSGIRRRHEQIRARIYPSEPRKTQSFARRSVHGDSLAPTLPPIRAPPRGGKEKKRKKQIGTQEQGGARTGEQILVDQHGAASRGEP